MKKDGSDHSAHSYVHLPSRPGALFLYDVFLSLYAFIIKVYALVNDKAKQWIAGRKNWKQQLEHLLIPEEKKIWIHCASLGEYEQARPVIEALKKNFPKYKTVVTFFSPSGFNAYKNNEFVDYVFYLPVDTRRNAAYFISLLRPSLAAFVKYEFWYHYLAELHRQQIPTILVSGAFREGQIFSKWYGGLFRDLLQCFDFFFLQDKESQTILYNLGFNKNVVISGDTRYDRVAAIARNVRSITEIEQFKGTNKLLIAGSTWPGDETILKECVDYLPPDWKIIIAPHEIGTAHLQAVEQLFDSVIYYSSLNEACTGADKKVLIIDNIGLLSRIFAYGDIAFIGGGFHNEGIHNILEPAVFGLPVIFGPEYKKFVEAKQLVAEGLVFPITDAASCNIILSKLINDNSYRAQISSALKLFMKQQTGATEIVIKTISQQHWL